ncbi:DEAD-box ATP-dependent RNA helicase 17 isoform X2 [Nymphaea colorata]|uniref:DEAD-box ATP-dependent RNA helicase 17 isoform X2 n=1 Tax=Nymphaea colorata TaxID=210225 RepID=UPI00129D43B8|nr:DEAD-box ATP-dependent RNA helicase 17 isoform X2 [Nymphaea colorata]
MGEEGEKQQKNKKNEQEKNKLHEREGSLNANVNLFASCSFEDLGLHTSVCDQLRDRMGFKVPTIIQGQAIPVVMSGRHVLVNAATGTGKTIVYLAPVVHHLQKFCPRINRADGTFALVLVPTRELCMQVYEILQNLLHRFHWIVPGYVMGGENRSKEKARLRKGISILIATPGRLLDHLKHTSSFLYKNLRWLIFDEADRILELGFGKDIEEILNILGTRESGSGNDNNKVTMLHTASFSRQNLLLSATLNEKVNNLAKISLENPAMIGLEGNTSNDLKKFSAKDTKTLADSIQITNLVQQPDCSAGDYRLPIQLVQRYVKVTCGSRLVALLSTLRFLYERETSQKDARRTSFQGFNAERSAVLLCTDVAARGLDFPKVKHIVQYDSPGDAIEYVHRVGRTARLGEKGDALLFLLAVELDYLQELQKHGVSLDEFPLQKVLDSFPLPRGWSRRKVISLDLHPWVTNLQKAIESFISSEPQMKKLAKDAFCSWVRAYTAHRGELKRIFMVKKLHLGHVAKSFGLREQPSLVGRSFQMQLKKRKREHKMDNSFKKRRMAKKR